MLCQQRPKTVALSARSPAKLIISGEHAVVHGAPALAIAVDRYTQVQAIWREQPQIHFNLSDLKYVKSFTYQALKTMGGQIKNDYHNFLNGKKSISQVLTTPFQLLQFAVIQVLETMNLQLPLGIEIKVDSTIPIGCGMGSSAAVIVSTLHALVKILGLNWQAEDFVKFAQDLENIQHGKSSGIDLHLVNYGGCLRYQAGLVQHRKLNLADIYMVNTGKPASSTGECVTKTSKIFTSCPQLLNQFIEITTSIEQALVNNNKDNFKLALRENHRLLREIKVVPAKVHGFIMDIEQQGGAGKTCGAGACYGDNAGMVLVTGEYADLMKICRKYGYKLESIKVDNYGTQII